MDSQDELRHWIRKQLAAHHRGARVRLAEFLDLTPMQITNMLNMNIGQQTRGIQADEWLKILLFLGVQESNPAVPRAALQKGKPVIVPPPHSAVRLADHAMLIKIYNSAKPKQREAIVKLIQSFAEAYNIPH